MIVMVSYCTEPIYKANGYTYPVFCLIQREITLDVAWNIPASNLGPFPWALLFIRFPRIVVIDVIEFCCSYFSVPSTHFFIYIAQHFVLIIQKVEDG